MRRPAAPARALSRDRRAVWLASAAVADSVSCTTVAWRPSTAAARVIERVALTTSVDHSVVAAFFKYSATTVASGHARTVCANARREPHHRPTDDSMERSVHRARVPHTRIRSRPRTESPHESPRRPSGRPGIRLRNSGSHDFARQQLGDPGRGCALSARLRWRRRRRGRRRCGRRFERRNRKREARRALRVALP